MTVIETQNSSEFLDSPIFYTWPAILNSNGLRISAISVLVCLLVAGPLFARDRRAAREAFRKALEYHESLLALPEGQRTLKGYKRAVHLFRRVIDHDPTYGAADDSLFAIAGLYDEMASRFSNETYLERAIYYYDFVAREYPTTRFRQQALQRAADLRAPPPVQDQPTEVATEGWATLAEVRYWSNEDYTRVVLQLDREVEFEKSVLTNPDRIYFDLFQTRLEPGMIERNYEVNGLFIKQVRVAKNRPGVIRVVLDFDRLSSHTVFALYDPFRIVVDTRRETRGDTSAMGPDEDTMKTGAAVISLEKGADQTQEIEEKPRVPSPTKSGDLTLTRVLGLKVGRIVLDPGHGGKDPGTTGPSGLKEKDLVLDVALRLRKLLEAELQTDVIMTREDDRFIPLEERTAIANKNGADLFISIHANAWHNPRVSGVETYVLDFARSPAERAVASRENASAQRNINELEDLLKKIALEDYNAESRDLAQVIQSSLYKSLRAARPDQVNRGVKQAPFIVLIGSEMPSILTEIGYVTNPEDEALFKTSEGRQQVAQALYQAIQDYFRSLGSLADSHATARYE